MQNETRIENKQKVAKLFETFNTGDLAPIDELIAPDYAGPQGGTGPDSFRSVVVGLRTSFPDIHYTIDDLLADEDKVVIRWHWTGTFKAPFRGNPATGVSVTNPGLAIFRCRDGKIVAANMETDRLGFLEQIGAVPKR